MWRKEDGNPQASPEVTPNSAGLTVSGKVGTSSLSTPSASSKAPACVSQGIKIKGEVTGTEDLFVDGLIEGKITLANSSVTVGPNGTVKAEITAREVVVRGIAEGKFTAAESIQIWRTARVQGDLKSERISIEDGAELRGKVEAGNTAGRATGSDTPAQGKKSESGKGKDAVTNDVNAASGAATAGAD
jgi:cytoskeletal protein CcmA (bactofilin family)